MKSLLDKSRTQLRILFEKLQYYDFEYGDIKIIETPQYFIIETYNGGWSHNEAIDCELVDNKFKYLSDHPITIYAINRIVAEIQDKKFPNGKFKLCELLEMFRKAHGSKKKKKYTYKLEMI